MANSVTPAATTNPPHLSHLSHQPLQLTPLPPSLLIPSCGCSSSLRQLHYIPLRFLHLELPCERALVESQSGSSPTSNLRSQVPNQSTGTFFTNLLRTTTRLYSSPSRRKFSVEDQIINNNSTLVKALLSGSFRASTPIHCPTKTSSQ